MDFIALLIGLGPLLGWGLFPTIASKFGGRPVNQIFGRQWVRSFCYCISLSKRYWHTWRNGARIFNYFRCRMGIWTNHYI